MKNSWSKWCYTENYTPTPNSLSPFSLPHPPPSTPFFTINSLLRPLQRARTHLARVRLYFSMSKRMYICINWPSLTRADFSPLSLSLSLSLSRSLSLSLSLDVSLSRSLSLALSLAHSLSHYEHNACSSERAKTAASPRIVKKSICRLF